MGLFLETAVIPRCGEDKVREVLSQIPRTEGSGYQCRAVGGGVSVLFESHCGGYDRLARDMSARLESPVLYLYIYDDDFWGYFLCKGGELLDEFNTMPDYHGELTGEERRQVAGKPALVAEQFQVPEEEIRGYLQPWSEDIWDEEEPPKAYESDEFTQGDCWQMADFMAALGYPYSWDD